MFPRNPVSAGQALRSGRASLIIGLLCVLGVPGAGPGVRAAAAPSVGTAIPARPLPAFPPFRYLHPGRPAPPALPGERSVLTLEGGGPPVALTMRQLQALPALRYQTKHPQLRRSFTYEGVALRDLAVRGGFVGKDLRLYASNGFASTILARDYLNTPIMLAYRADGRPIPVLQKGPLTVVLPPTPARYHESSYSAAWVWFVERITPMP